MLWLVLVEAFMIDMHCYGNSKWKGCLCVSFCFHDYIVFFLRMHREAVSLH